MGGRKSPFLVFPHLPWCLCTTGMRLWMWKATQWMMWMMVQLHQGCYEACPLCQGYLHKEGKVGYSCRWLPFEGNRGSYLPDRHCFSGTLLPLWFKDITRKLLSLVQVLPWSITHCFSSIWVVIKLWRVVQGQLNGPGMVGKQIWSRDNFLFFFFLDTGRKRQTQSTNTWLHPRVLPSVSSRLHRPGDLSCPL